MHSHINVNVMEDDEDYLHPTIYEIKWIVWNQIQYEIAFKCHCETHTSNMKWNIEYQISKMQCQ